MVVTFSPVESAIMQRRKFLSRFTLAGLTGLITLGWSAISTAATATKKPKFVTAGTIAALKKAGTIVTSINGKSITVFPNPQNPKEFLAMNLACTHNGCAVNWDGATKTLLCPCHGAAYDLDGKVLKAPATAGLTRYPVKVVKDKILVQTA
jgi:cytochrome b6-f complex iron-sulfur subunit